MHIHRNLDDVVGEAAVLVGLQPAAAVAGADADLVGASAAIAGVADVEGLGRGGGVAKAMIPIEAGRGDFEDRAGGAHDQAHGDGLRAVLHGGGGAALDGDGGVIGARGQTGGVLHTHGEGGRRGGIERRYIQPVAAGDGAGVDMDGQSAAAGVGGDEGLGRRRSAVAGHGEFERSLIQLQPRRLQIDAIPIEIAQFEGHAIGGEA